MEKKPLNINNPHDKFFKAVLEDKHFSVAFIKDFLPKSLVDTFDLATLQHLKTSFISDDLSETFADLLFSISRNNGAESVIISILIEHKSYLDPNVDFQLLSYLSQAYNRQLSDNQKKSIIVPVIFYHGTETWLAPKLHEHFDHDYNTQKYLPIFERIFVDINTLTDPQMTQLETKLLVSALSLSKIDSNDLVLRQLSNIINSLSQYKSKNLIKTFIVYTFTTTKFSKAMAETLLKAVPSDVRNDIKSTYEQFVDFGIEKGLALAILNLHKNGISKEKIADLLEISLEKVISALKNS